ncbi:MAG: RidA family protein [Planctomycetota bacterium]|nr:RidA family protein [Planctomycetota bacterium]
MTTTSRTPISTPHAPAAVGPYSQAIVAGGFVHCAGQVALVPETGKMLDGDVAAQTERVFQNLKAVLAEAGTSLERAVKVQVWLKSMDDFATVNGVYAKHFEGMTPPARACVEVARLPLDALVEIDCLALVD